MSEMDEVWAAIKRLQQQVANLDARTLPMQPLGPGSQCEKELAEHQSKEFQRIIDEVRAKQVPPVDRSAQELTDGSPVPEDRSHTELKENGQQKGYVVLSPEERSKGFVRPVRQSYIHVGPLGPKYPLRDLDPATEKHFEASGYVKFEQYPGEAHVTNGRLWMQSQLDAVGKGCGTRTTMGLALAETYARDPKFYGGTFCCGCGKHLPVDEFIWDDGSEERVGR